MSHQGRHHAREPLAMALAQGQTVRDACAALNLAERTAHRWLKVPAFQARVRELRAEMVQQALGKLSDTMGLAADRLRALMSAQSEAAAVSAARAVLDFGLRVREQADLEERLAKLEAQQAARQDGQGAAGGAT